MAEQRIGRGILSWCGSERRTDRYGAVNIISEPYDSGEACIPELDLGRVMGLVGKRVKMWVVAVETRKSGHIGDMMHKIKPSTPDLGERIDLGVGVLRIEQVEWDANPAIILQPDDGRQKFWIDPRRLYRAHDQTVELFIEPTDQPFSPRPCLRAGEVETISTGEVPEGSAFGNTYQVKGRKPAKVLPHFENLGDGMFTLSHEPVHGRRHDVQYEDE